MKKKSKNNSRLLCLLFITSFASAAVYAAPLKVTTQVDFGQNSILSPTFKLGYKLDAEGRHSDINLVAAYGLSGKKLKTDQKRTIRLLDSSNASDSQFLVQKKINLETLNDIFDKKFTHLNKYYFIANFAHGRIDKTATQPNGRTQYWVAILPKDVQFNQMIDQIEWSGGGVGAHNQLRFKTDQPILLVPQENSKYTSIKSSLIDYSKSESDLLASMQKSDVPVKISGDFVYSLLAIRVQGGFEDWDPVKGQLGEFANSYGLLSSVHIAGESIIENYVEQFEVIMPDKKIANKVLDGLLNSANRAKESRIYNTVYDNCVIAVQRGLKLQGYPDVDADIFNPYKIVDDLTKNKVINPTPLSSFNDDFRKWYPTARLALDSTNKDKFDKINLALGFLKSEQFDKMLRFFAGKILVTKLSYTESQFLFEYLQSVAKNSDFDVLKNDDDLKNYYAHGTKLDRSLIDIDNIKGIVSDLRTSVTTGILKGLTPDKLNFLMNTATAN